MADLSNTQSEKLPPAFTPNWISEVLGYPVPKNESSPHHPYSQLLTDSRKITQGSLFIALKGEQFDGHSFVETSLKLGARAALVEENVNLPSHIKDSCFLVPDTLVAFRALGAAWRKKFNIPFLLVAGSVGKTTTKEFLASCLSQRGKVLKTEESQNGFVGIPMTLLNCQVDHQFAVIEVGIDEIGAMEKHLSLVDPSLALLTALGPEHLEKLKDVSTAAQEELLALKYTAKKNRPTLINLDDALIRPEIHKFVNAQSWCITLEGRKQPEDSGHFISATFNPKTNSLEIPSLNYHFTSPLPGIHNARNLLLALTACFTLGLSSDEIQAGLLNFKDVKGRSQFITLKGKEHSLAILCDYYNANPSSVVASLEVLDQYCSFGPIWVCLGDMLELGSNEERYHRELALNLSVLHQHNRPLHVLLYGRRMLWLKAELTKHYPQVSTHHFQTHEDLAKALLDQAKGAQALLIKGSRSMQMEKVFEILKAQIPKQW